MLPKSSFSKTRKNKQSIGTSLEILYTIEDAPTSVKKAYKNRFSKNQPNLERGIDFAKVNDDHLKALLNHHHWTKLATCRTESVNLTIVREFYSALSQVASSDSDHVVVRMMSVAFNAKEINSFYGIKNIPDVTYIQKWELDNKAKLFQKRLEAKQIIGPDVVWAPNHKRFNFVGIKKNDRVIKHLINSNIFPTTHLNDYTPEEACLALAFINKQPIDMGKIIFNKAYTFASKKIKSKIPFPDLITALCRKYDVPEFDDDLIIPPSTILIGTRILDVLSPDPQDPSTQESTPAPSSSLTTEDMFSYMNARVDVLEQNMLNMGTDFSTMMNDIRGGIRGMKDYHTFLHHNTTPNPYYNCPSEPYSL